MKADQDFVRRVLQPRVGLVQLASRFARQLAELVTIGHMAQCPENQIRTHYGYLLKKWLPERNYWRRQCSWQPNTPQLPILLFLCYRRAETSSSSKTLM